MRQKIVEQNYFFLLHRRGEGARHLGSPGGGGGAGAPAAPHGLLPRPGHPQGPLLGGVRRDGEPRYPCGSAGAQVGWQQKKFRHVET